MEVSSFKRTSSYLTEAMVARLRLVLVASTSELVVSQVLFILRIMTPDSRLRHRICEVRSLIAPRSTKTRGVCYLGSFIVLILSYVLHKRTYDLLSSSKLQLRRFAVLQGLSSATIHMLIVRDSCDANKHSPSPETWENPQIPRLMFSLAYRTSHVLRLFRPL